MPSHVLYGTHTSLGSLLLFPHLLRLNALGLKLVHVTQETLKQFTSLRSNSLFELIHNLFWEPVGDRKTDDCGRYEPSSLEALFGTPHFLERIGVLMAHPESDPEFQAYLAAFRKETPEARVDGRPQLPNRLCWTGPFPCVIVRPTGTRRHI